MMSKKGGMKVSSYFSLMIKVSGSGSQTLTQVLNIFVRVACSIAVDAVR
jgi:hypothetical protein